MLAKKKKNVKKTKTSYIFKQILSISNVYIKCSHEYKKIFNDEYFAQKIKFSIKDFLSKCDQMGSLLRIWSHLLKKFLIENFIFCAVRIKQCIDSNNQKINIEEY